MTHFDHLSLRNAKLYLTSTAIPYENLKLDFDKNFYATSFKAFTDFRKFYLGKENDGVLNIDTYKSKYPFMVFNCSFLEPSLKVNSVDIRLECEFSKNIPDNTTLIL